MFKDEENKNEENKFKNEDSILNTNIINDLESFINLGGEGVVNKNIII
jgi:hypothetical protein